MPKMNNDQPEYFKAEFFGEPNSGKSYTACSVGFLIPPQSKKRKILYLTNESTWKTTIEEPDFKSFKDDFDVRYHINLSELRQDWADIIDEYTITNPKTKERKFNYYKFEQEVHAIILDEAEFIYREGFLTEFIELQRKIIPTYKLVPKDYGGPRAEFTIFTKKIFSKPCHVIITSKVGFEYEGVRRTKKDGKLGSLTFERTGKHTYRLPDSEEYEPNLRGYLFSSERSFNEEKDEPQYDEAGDLIEYYNYWGRIKKNKVDRDVQPVVKNPDMRKFKQLLDRMRRQKLKKDGK